MRVYLDYVHNCRGDAGRKASVWVTKSEYYERVKDCPPWGSSSIADAKGAALIIGPVDYPVAKQAFKGLKAALVMLGHDVVSDETSDA